MCMRIRLECLVRAVMRDRVRRKKNEKKKWKKNEVKNEVNKLSKNCKHSKFAKMFNNFQKKKYSFILFFDVQWTLFTCMQQINV